MLLADRVNNLIKLKAIMVILLEDEAIVFTNVLNILVDKEAELIIDFVVFLINPELLLIEELIVLYTTLTKEALTFEDDIKDSK